ncbi:MAG TPA: Tm-1-like ATP-binding domain-containing protein [Streptosporangiaceae bacterium]|nr:Tm-1-like ATP-binding domain-containing protein [Streptosporangiaceae bacterium]
MATVVLVGTLDTKGAENEFVRDQLRAAGVDVLVVDTGVLEPPGFRPDITRQEVAAAAGADFDALVAARDRGAAITAMATGAEVVVRRLHEEGRLDGALALGGTGGTSIATRAFRALPLGVPKLVVSTAASGNTADYIRETDLILMPSVTDIAGLNRISTRILANAAAAVAGMVLAAPLATALAEERGGRPMVAASMFGVTTPCITRARARLETLGYEVLVFHMTGTGGRTLESLAAQGLLAGVLDATTTELADELMGGIFSAGPDRLSAAGKAGIPQVVSVGALDMVNFGPMDTVPAEFKDRNLYVHNPITTLMRTTAAENTELGTRLARRLNTATGPTSLFLPLRGVSAIDRAGAPFWDEAADRALFGAIQDQLDTDKVELVEMDMDVNDDRFADAMADRLHQLITKE